MRAHSHHIDCWSCISRRVSRTHTQTHSHRTPKSFTQRARFSFGLGRPHRNTTHRIATQHTTPFLYVMRRMSDVMYLYLPIMKHPYTHTQAIRPGTNIQTGSLFDVRLRSDTTSTLCACFVTLVASGIIAIIVGSVGRPVCVCESHMLGSLRLCPFRILVFACNVRSSNNPSDDRDWNHCRNHRTANAMDAFGWKMRSSITYAHDSHMRILRISATDDDCCARREFAKDSSIACMHRKAICGMQLFRFCRTVRKCAPQYAE